MAAERVEVMFTGQEWVARAGEVVLARSRLKQRLLGELGVIMRARGDRTPVLIRGRSGEISEVKSFGRRSPTR